jgi:hypothetical protein
VAGGYDLAMPDPEPNVDHDLLQNIYAAFSPAPLTEQDSELYVDLDAVRGEADIVKRMSFKMRLSQGKPTCQVLAGHRGSGKSTEFYRLRRELEKGDPKMFVVFCTADDDIDRNDVDFPDLLVAIIRQTAKQLDDRERIVLKPGYFKDRLQRLGKLLTSEIDFDKFTLETGLGKLGLTIKGSPDARAEIRKLMEPDTGNLLKAANDVISEAVLELDKKGYRGLVILVDDLDKMVVRPHDDGDCSTAEYLFVRRAAQLTAFDCHVVYSMPISLAYSHAESAIKANYSGHVPIVPMTKIKNPPPGSERYEPGFQRFHDIAAKRLARANAVESDLFQNSEMLGNLIELSGGQPSEFMTLVREAIVTNALPIKDHSIQRAQREGQREYARQLREEQWPIIKSVSEFGQFKRTEKNERLFRELLESRAILQYVNGEEWYGLNPMVAALLEKRKR